MSGSINIPVNQLSEIATSHLIRIALSCFTAEAEIAQLQLPESSLNWDTRSFST